MDKVNLFGQKEIIIKENLQLIQNKKNKNYIFIKNTYFKII
jgi:hypothetical protein